MDRKSFLNELYRYCDGTIELRAITKDKPAIVDFFFIGAIESINKFCVENKNRHLYFGVATRDGGGTEDHLVNIPAVWCDVDYKVTPKQILAEKYKQLPIRPTFIVQSGGGVHFYWMLKEPATKEDIPKVKLLNKQLAVFLGGDLNSCDAARILRLPDTINHKYPAPCKISSFEKNNEYVFSDFYFLPEYVENSNSNNSNGGSIKENWIAEQLLQSMSEGDGRNPTAVKLAGYFLKALPFDIADSIIKLWNNSNIEPLSDKEISSVITSAKRYGVFEETVDFSVSMDDVYDAEKMLIAYEQHIEQLKKQSILKTGIDNIDKNIRGVAPGEVLVILARSGVFKTAFLQHILQQHCFNSKEASVFFSLEMPIANVTERYLQSANNLTGEEVEYKFSQKENVDMIKFNIKLGLKNLYVIEKKCSLEQIKEYVLLIEKTKKIKVGCIGIDYLGLIDCDSDKEYEAISKVSIGSKQLAKELKMPVILLSQINRQGGDGTERVDLSWGRGSGKIEESADFVLSLFKKIDDTGAAEILEVICEILKNRKGMINKCFSLKINPATFIFEKESEEWKPKKQNKKTAKLKDDDELKGY